jgi:hypothetical protein
MKRNFLIQLSALSFVALSMLACQKNETADPNQPLIDQMKAVNDSLQKRRLTKDFNQFGPVHSYGLCLFKVASFYGHNGFVWGYTS